jgi:hypothetical protein
MGMTILEELLRDPRAVKNPYPDPEDQLEFPELLRTAMPVRIDAVYRYAQEHRADFVRSLESLPVAPPWRCAFYEWNLPSWVDGHPVPPDLRDGHGVLSMAAQRDGVSWQWALVGYQRYKGGIWRKPGVLFDLNAAGQMEDSGYSFDRDDWRGDVPSWWFTQYELPVLLANVFAHCKNVEITDAVPPPKLSAKQEKRYGIPKLTYKTLNIVPMQQTLRSEGGMDRGNSLAKALHICRGHFADYREGPGLFGRYHGLVWRDMHVRGDKKAGMVVKDYEVRTA